MGALPCIVLAGGLAVQQVVPTEVEMPGTQPLQVTNLPTADKCAGCHGGYDSNHEPWHQWQGSMMAHAGRDPMFWATVAVAEQDFPGAGDLCLRCHTPNGWMQGRSTPTDGSAMLPEDSHGVECIMCHRMVTPDDSEYVGTQTAPYIANDEGTPPTSYHGSGMMVLWPGNDRIGPYTNHVARHAALGSSFIRSSEMCATCHDVSNPVVGDLAHNNGALTPLLPGTFSGVPGTPVDQKAAFNNFPFAYGIVERTSSEHAASAFPTMTMADVANLPPELQGGAIHEAWEAATYDGTTSGNFENGDVRTFSCQTCHMPPSTGAGSDKNNSPVRTDLGRHDLTGGNYWVPKAIQWLDAQNRLRLGGGLDAATIQMMNDGVQRAIENLQLAALLEVEHDTVTVTNRTGHKLISGFPEGRRMWVRTRWYDALGAVLRTDGDYGDLQVQIAGQPTTVRTLADLHDPNTRIYMAHYGMTSDWAQQLLSLGHSASLVLEYDRVTGAPAFILGDLGALAPGDAHETLHFVLNNTVLSDNRIPPYRMDRDEAIRRNAQPVPDTQYGNPASGGVYEHFDAFALQPPTGATYAEVDLLYQPTSWEYIQFLALANDGTNAFLGNTGQDILDAWQATGMAEPERMQAALWADLPGTGSDLVLETTVNGAGDSAASTKTVEDDDVVTLTMRSPGGTFAGGFGFVMWQFHNPAQPPQPMPGLADLHINRLDGYLLVPVLPAQGATLQITVPELFEGLAARAQGIILDGNAANGLFHATDAHQVLGR